MTRSPFRKILFSSGAVRFHMKDGWTFDDMKKIAPDTRIIFFNDEYPYFIADRVDIKEIMKYRPIPSYVFKEDTRYSIEENIMMRNL